MLLRETQPKNAGDCFAYKNFFVRKAVTTMKSLGYSCDLAFIGGKEDSAALLALGSSFFSREVVIKSQGKGKKDNGKQRQL